jgi:hypothetical protein
MRYSLFIIEIIVILFNTLIHSNLLNKTSRKGRVNHYMLMMMTLLKMKNLYLITKINNTEIMINYNNIINIK